MSEYEYEYVFGSKKSLDKVITNERIVRCRDCAHWHCGYCYAHAVTITKYDICNDPYPDDEGMVSMDEDGFCSLGERKECA